MRVRESFKKAARLRGQTYAGWSPNQHPFQQFIGTFLANKPWRIPLNGGTGERLRFIKKPFRTSQKGF
jgi:hypothetical protein